jgi:hypothetical protein
MNELDIETIMNFVNEMNRKYPYQLEFLPHNILPDQTILKIGNKVYYSPNIKSGEVKVVDVPEADLEMKVPTLNIEYTAFDNEMHLPSLMHHPILP